MNDFNFEMFKSVSSQTSEVNEFDQIRLGTYLDAIDTFHAWIMDQPHLDLPVMNLPIHNLQEMLLGGRH